MDFSTFNLRPEIQIALEKQRLFEATAVQEQAIPAILQGKDLLAIAPTGTGKTEAFLIPLLQQLLLHPSAITSPQVLILSPTRELALQTEQRFQSLAADMPLTAACIYGGKSYDSQREQLATNPAFIIATPGRLLDLIQQAEIDLSTIQSYVLDEADQLLDFGFLENIHLIKKNLPPTCQKLLFSATFPQDLQQAVKQLLIDPIAIHLSLSAKEQLIQEQVLFVDKVDKKKLIHFLIEEFKLQQLLIFTRTTASVDRIVQDLTKHQITAQGLYGDKSQKSRELILDNFRSAHIQVLVATDIAARGLDIPDLPAIINYEIPDDKETYTHRIGRTGRGQQSGLAFTFCDAEDNPKYLQLQQQLKRTLPIYDQHPYLLSWQKMLATSHVNNKGKKKSRR